MHNINKLYSPVGQSRSQSLASGSPLPGASAGSPSALQPSAFRIQPFTPTGQFSAALHQQHRSLELPQVLTLLRQHVARQWWSTEVVGLWVWVYQSPGLRQTERSALFELWFHWNPRRQAWQHPCGVLTPGATSGPLPRYVPAQQVHVEHAS